MPTEQPHGPVCIGLDAGCPDCKRMQAAAARVASAEPNERMRSAFPALVLSTARTIRSAADALIKLAGEVDPESEDAANTADEILSDPRAMAIVFGGAPPEDDDSDDVPYVPAPEPQPTPADLVRWRRAARWVPGPMGRCIRILLAEVEHAQRKAAELARELDAERSEKNAAALTIGDVLMAGFRDTTAHVAALLKKLDRRGGLGLDVHAEITDALRLLIGEQNVTGALARIRDSSAPLRKLDPRGGFGAFTVEAMQCAMCRERVPVREWLAHVEKHGIHVRPADPDSEPCPVRGNGFPCIAGVHDACLWCGAFMPPPPGFAYDDGET